MFDVYTSKSKDKNKINFSDSGKYEFIGRTSTNYGIQGYVNELEYKPNPANTFSLAQVGETVALFREHEWYGSQNMFVLVPKNNEIIKNHLFFESVFYRILRKYSDAYVYPILDEVKELEMKLPLINNEINYDFMNTFIEELEALRIEELEAYLTITGLKGYNLSEDEQSILNNYNTIKFESFYITEIFNIKNTSNLLSSDIVKDSGTTPYLCASSENNAVSSYIKYDDKYIDEGNCIFIGGKTFVVTYQENDFYSNDSHNLSLYLKNEIYRNKLTQLFLSTCVKKSLAHKYSWGDSISGTKIKKDIIYLPVVDGNIDYKSMKILISAVQKLVIKDVVEYANKKINATKDIINNNQY